MSNVKSDLSVQQAIKARLRRTWPAFFERHGNFTPTQVAAIPHLLDGESVILSAPTASGKTEAVIAPLVERHCRDAASSLQILYLTPTKALANDLLERLARPLATLRLSTTIKTRDLSTFRPNHPSHVLVTTPESVDSLLTSQARVFANLRAIVLDELHLFDGSPRGDQLRVVMNRLRQVRAHAFASGDAPDDTLQVAALSATVDDPAGVAARYFPGALPIHVEGGRAIQADVLSLAPDGAGELIATFQTFRARGWRKVVAFCSSRAEVESYAAAVRRQSPFGSAVYVHYSNIEAGRRMEIEQQFAADEAAICFASSTLELGIDIGSIDAIILIGPPGNSRSFVQRIGRGNRRKRTIQVACFYRTPLEELIFRVLIDLATGERHSATDGEAFRPAVAVQQIFSLIKQSPTGAVRLEGITPLFEGMLSRQSLDVLLGHLREIDYLALGRPGEWKAGPRLGELIDEQAKSTAPLSIYSNVAGEQTKIEVRDRNTRRTVARVAAAWLHRPVLTLEGRALNVEWQDDEALWVSFDPGLDVAEKLPYRSARHWLSYEVSRLLPSRLGLARGTAPLVETPEGWMCFHWLGDLYGFVLLDLLGQRSHVGQTTQPGLCLSLFDGLAAWPAWSEAQVATYLADNYRKLEHMLALGPFHHLLPNSMRQRTVIEQVDAPRFLDAIAGLRLVRAPEELTEDLLRLVADS